jgi:hypothetical protein
LASSTFEAALLANIQLMNIYLPCFMQMREAGARALADGS